jgi:hypothetical protein
VTPSVTSSVTPSITSSETPSKTSSETPSITSSATPSETPVIPRDQAPIINISNYFSSTTIENIQSDNSIFLYVFIPLNVILIFCCVICIVVRLCRHSQPPVRNAWANAIPQESNSQIQIRTPSRSA